MENDIKILEELLNYDFNQLSKEEYQAIEHLIARNKELEEIIDTLNEGIENHFIPKSKVRVLIGKYRAFGWHNKDDEYWANRILDGFEELLQEGDK